MNALIFGLFLAIPSLPVAAAEIAQVRIDCLSLRFEPATGGPGQVATLDFSSDKSFSEVTGELWPLYDDTLPSHGSFFRLEDPTFPDSLAGNIAFDTPAPQDANGNGFDDFFELSQEVAATTTQGLFFTPVEQGSVTATWSRAAGSPTGSCRLSLVGETFGELPEFRMNFRLLELTGTFRYTRTSNSVPGLLTLAEPGNTANTLVGPIEFVRVATNRFNQLTFSAGALTNAAGQAIEFEEGGLDRDGTNYFGFLDLVDGDLATRTGDYLTWALSIDDANDTDADGHSDFSDDLGGSQGSSPKLIIGRASSKLLLSVVGQAGQTVEIQETGELGNTWKTAVSLTVTNSPQVLSLPLPGSSPTFWRAKVQP